jgi:hypothetical protein
LIKAILLRGLLAMGLGILSSAVISEISFRLQDVNTSRGPQTVLLVIPAGAAQRVAKGQSVLPKNQSFVVGDTHSIRNEDTVTHTLGPMVIPSGTTASLKLDQPENLAYTCSFQPNNYQGLDVREALTFSTRTSGWLIAGIPLGFLFTLYSLLVWPVKPKAA